MKILPIQQLTFLQNLEKGIYVDNPKNRRLIEKSYKEPILIKRDRFYCYNCGYNE